MNYKTKHFAYASLSSFSFSAISISFGLSFSIFLNFSSCKNLVC